MARSGMDRLYEAPAIASGFGLNDMERATRRLAESIGHYFGLAVGTSAFSFVCP